MRTWFVGPWELSRATAHLPPTPRDGRVLLIESTDKGSALPWHRWKLVLVLSALRHFVEELRAEGYEVDHRVARSYAEGIRAHIAEYGPSEVLIQEPAEWGIGESLRRLASEFGGTGNGEQGTGEPAPTPLSPFPVPGSSAPVPPSPFPVPPSPFPVPSSPFPVPSSPFPVPPSPDSVPCPTTVTILSDRRFITPRDAFYRWAEGRKLLRMEDFYRWQRKRLGILLDEGGKPQGGTWNLDKENRQGARALAKRGIPPEPLAFEPDAITRRVMRLVTKMGTAEYRVVRGAGDEAARRQSGKAAGSEKSGRAGPRESGLADAGDEPNGHWGSVDGFNLPVTRAQALAALDDFLAHRFRDFGPFEDAMLAGKTYLYHSRLSAAMNVGLLHPREMIDAAIRRWEESQSAGQKALGAEEPIPYQSLEGFVRQILGWREYINGIYWLKIPEYRASNYFGFERPLPQLYWEPERTDLACLRDSVTMVRDTAYAHHIHRLMVLSNFATLTGVHPLRLSEWFWAGFADAMEWVELPNVVGMATFGDGGLLASKPYISGAAYIDRMSNYCGGCRYNPKARTGENACPFNFLYWTFLDHVARKKFDVGQRMALALKLAADIPAEEMKAMRAARKKFVERLEPDATGWRFHYDQG